MVNQIIEGGEGAPGRLGARIISHSWPLGGWGKEGGREERGSGIEKLGGAWGLAG